MMKILYFGRLIDRAGRREDSFDLPKNIKTISALKIWLDKTHDLGGALADKSVKTMVNQVLIHDDVTLVGTEEIGFLPPVGGG